MVRDPSIVWRLALRDRGLTFAVLVEDGGLRGMMDQSVEVQTV